MKKVLIGLTAVVLIVVGVGVYIFANLDDIIKQAVEKVGSDATQTKVTLNSVDIDITQGTGGINGLKVGNPSGFKTPSAFELGAIKLHIDTATVDKNPIVIKSITINGPVVTYEKTGDKANVDVIKANVDQYAKKFGGSGGGGAAKKDDGPGKKLVIEKLTITGGKVNLNADMLGGKTLDASLPTITLTDIGKDSGGDTPADVAKQVIDKLTAGVMSINPEKLIGNAAKMIEGATKAATDAVKGATEGAGKAMKGVTGGAGDALKGAGDAGKGLFGK
ncbi:MAG: hypothetical protein VW268_00560 [Rhodospirillaceae bacterium]